jgi:hypothetical protein
MGTLAEDNRNAAGPGIRDAIVSSTVHRQGNKVVTQIAIDLGTSKATIASSTTDLDIIGVSGGGAAYLTQLTPAINGYITYAEMACVELPAGGVTDIDLYIATEGTSTQAFDASISDYTETAIITAGGAWALGEVDHYALTPGTAFDLGSEDKYLYIVGGADGTAADYTAGKYIITLEGYLAPDDI